MNPNYKRDWAGALMKAGLPIPSQYSISFTMLCPFHNDRRPSLYVHLEHDFWQCYAYPLDCGKGTIRTLISKYMGISLFEAEKMAITGNMAFGSDCGFFADIDYGNTFITKETLPEMKNFEYNKEAVPRWILNRGFDKKTLAYWHSGTDDINSLVVPINDEDNRMVGWLKRRPANFYPKYLYSKGLQKNKVLFGLGNIYNKYNLDEQKYILTTEGPLDTIWLDKFGYPSVALLGVTLSEYQSMLLRNTNIRELILCLDNDAVGQTNTKAMRESDIAKSFFITTVQLPYGYKDIQDIKDEKMIHDVIENRSLFF